MKTGIGEKVAALMELRQWTLEDVAQAVRDAGAPNVKYQHIQQLVQFPNRKPRYILELAAAFGMTAEQFQAWQPGEPEPPDQAALDKKLRPIAVWNNPDELEERAHVVIPRVALKFSAGTGGPEWYSDPDMTQGQAFRAGFLKRERLDASKLMTAYAEGDSMEERIRDGDSLLIDTSQRTVKDGNVYAIAWDENLRAKRLFKTPSGGLLIHSDNKEKYPAFEIPREQLGNLTIVGRVIHVSGSV